MSYSHYQFISIYTKTIDSYKTQCISVFLRKITLFLVVIFKSLLMQKKGYYNGSFFSSVSILLLSDLVMLFAGCRNSIGETGTDNRDGNKSRLNIPEVNPEYVRFSPFQNQDSTWGYTIFVNSRPYFRVSRTPFKKSGPGFRSREDAEIVAGLMVKMIKSGDLNPKFDKKLLDSLELNMKLKKETGR